MLNECYGMKGFRLLSYVKDASEERSLYYCNI